MISMAIDGANIYIALAMGLYANVADKNHMNDSNARNSTVVFIMKNRIHFDGLSDCRYQFS